MKDLKEIENKIKELIGIWAEEKLKIEKQSNKIRYSGPVFGKEEYSNMMDAIFNNWWSGGKYTVETENKLAEKSKRNHAVLANSGSSANLILMSAAKELYYCDGEKILTLATGFPTTVNPIIQNRLIPVFMDIDLNDFSVKLEDIEHVLQYDNKIRAIFIAHTLGFPAKIKELLQIARKYHIDLWFDNCDSYGTKFEGDPIEMYGKAATYSFYVAHHLSMGEGGAISTNDDRLTLTMKSFRGWGRYCSLPDCCIRARMPEAFCPPTKLTPNTELPDDYMVNYIFEYLGYNLKPLDLQAAILSAQLDKAESFDNIRRENYTVFLNYFKNTNFRTWEINNEISPFAFPLLLPEDTPFERKHLINHLKINKIESRLLFGGNLTKHPTYLRKSQYWEKYGPLINSNKIMNDFLMLGVSQVNSKENIEKVIDVIDSFLRKW